ISPALQHECKTSHLTGTSTLSDNARPLLLHPNKWLAGVRKVRGSTIVMVAVAAVFGVLSVFMAQTWLNRQADARMKSMQAQPKTITTRTVVVAKSPLRFGNPVAANVLREVEWPSDAIPANTF